MTDAYGMWRCVSRTLLPLLTALLAGCGGNAGPERTVVSGTVTFDGKPLLEGAIRLVPLPNCPAPTTVTRIVDGKYSFDKLGGAPVGTHRIQFEAYRKINVAPRAGIAAPRPMAEGGLEQYIPEKYNARTQLEITISPGSGQITKDFQLTK
jgi:hypothetical protein